VAILTVSSTGNQSIEDFSIDVARKWELGDKTRDDGVLLVIAFDDRTLRIETGSGIEGELTDVEAGRIIDAIIAPQLKAGKPDAAALDGASAITSELSAAPGETVAIEANTASTGGSFLSRIFFIAFFLLLAVMFIIRGRKQGFGNVASNVLFVAATAIRNGSNGRGGGFSGGGGGGFSGGGASGSW
ncbi:MAG: TPM domain-containing protein, partial [Actinobacteria bacterium]|nr:TPM domain-containing protein [Actinomycetota bacterium]